MQVVSYHIDHSPVIVRIHQCRVVHCERVNADGSQPCSNQGKLEEQPREEEQDGVDEERENDTKCNLHLRLRLQLFFDDIRTESSHAVEWQVNDHG